MATKKPKKGKKLPPWLAKKGEKKEAPVKGKAKAKKKLPAQKGK